MRREEVKKGNGKSGVVINIMNDGKENKGINKKKKGTSIAPDNCPGILIFLKFNF